MDSARHRDLVKNLVPDDQLWREIRSERDAIITVLETAGKGATEVEEVIGAEGVRYRWDASQRLGGGSYGQVYRGTAADGTEVAVKVVPIRTDSATRWVGDTMLTERELLVLQRLGPDNLLPLLDATLSDDRLVLVMPLAGPSLAETIRSAPLEEARVRALVLDVARGLQQLAPHGVVHRDIAPGNILRWNDRWVLGDFGIARIVQDATAPYTWAMTGTRDYWAPELFCGAAATVQSDLYALGCVAVEALTGRKGFSGDDPASLSRFPCEPRVVNGSNLSESESSGEGDDECVECCLPAVSSGS
jgi:serine/threonine protein kinase